jgi:DNA recombination protein RmuC
MLASKTYWDQFDESPEFVILFIPGDQFLSAALNEEPDLIEYALSKQIILATPTSLVALLKAVAYGWRQLALADNAKEIRVLAEDLYGRLATFVGHMNRVGRQLASSVDHYNKAVGSLERNVLPGARKFVELGVHEKKAIEKLESLDPVPRTMIESSSDEDDAADLADAANDKTLQ